MKQFYLLATYLWSLWSVKMASVAEAKRSFWTLVNLWKAKKSATLTLKSVKGDLRLSFSVSLGQHEHEKPEDKKSRQSLKRDASSSKQRRKQRRAADPAVQLRAEAHAAAQAQAAASVAEEAEVETLRSEKPAEKPPLAPSPEKEPVREELVDEPGDDGFCEFVEVPDDFGTPDYDYEPEKVEKAMKILSQRNRCCFCVYECPIPKQQESGKRLFGVLEDLWDHIENEHPRAFDWLG